MVSAELYFKTYFNAIHDRNVLLIRKISEKERIDAGIAKGKITEGAISQVIELIGKDDRLRKGTIDQQSIRHLLSKMLKSTAFFEKNRAELEKKAAAEKAKLPKKLSNALDTHMNTVKETVPKFESFVVRLSETYEKEYTALAARDYETYKRLLTQETTILVEFQEYRRAALAKIYDELGIIINGMAQSPEFTFLIPIYLMVVAASSGVISFVADLPAAGAMVTILAGAAAVAGLSAVRLFKAASGI